MDKFVNILPTIIAVEALFASIVCAIDHRWGSAFYWISASAITVAVMLIPRLG